MPSFRSPEGEFGNHGESDKSYGKKGRPLLFRVRDVRLHDGRPVRHGGNGHDERAGTDAALFARDSVFLVHARVAGGGGVDDGDSGRRRLLSLGASEFWRFLGIPGGLVELERVLAAGRKLRGPAQRLSGDFLPFTGRLEALPCVRGADFPAGVHQYSRNPDSGRGSNSAGDFRADSSAAALCDCRYTVASQSVSTLCAATRVAVPGVWGRACPWPVALF